MSDEDEVLREAETIINNAMGAFVSVRRNEHIGIMPKLYKGFSELVKNKQSDELIHLAYITPSEVLSDSPNVDRFLDLEPSESEPNEQAGYLFYAFPTVNSAMECLSMATASFMAHELMPEGTSAYMLVRRKKYGIGVLIANDCLTVSRVVKDESHTEHIDLMAVKTPDKSPESFFASVGVTDKEGELIKQFIEFHCKPAMIKRDYPNVYKAAITRIHKSIDERDDNDESEGN